VCACACVCEREREARMTHIFIDTQNVAVFVWRGGWGCWCSTACVNMTETLSYRREGSGTTSSLFFAHTQSRDAKSLSLSFSFSYFSFLLSLLPYSLSLSLSLYIYIFLSLSPLLSLFFSILDLVIMHRRAKLAQKCRAFNAQRT